MSAPRSLRIVVHGRVQGVGYRAWLAMEAGRRGLRGWVRNRRDGTVEALLHADEATLEALVDACRHGPAAAAVRAIDLFETDEMPPTAFEVRSSA
ncbi:acylphosphatase [Ancylobacter sp. Lp-2]|uniref:acylphosphatase n=1 Tax=Ancylobacter sp. Lp-2 TaxID=2881339 RepID=UPI001E314859|nr:acylphosphatase [Ancylobacter sp. Lp-2]MCB4768427.1 acylphosphatase [Ancylobacter sp. Lp-2]